MKNKLWWKVLVSTLMVSNVVVIMLVFSSAKPGEAGRETEEHTRFESVHIPEKVSFAGEDMPLNRFYVKEALDRELLSNAYFHSQTIRYIKLAPRYFPIIEPILKAM